MSILKSIFTAAMAGWFAVAPIHTRSVSAQEQAEVAQVGGAQFKVQKYDFETGQVSETYDIHGITREGEFLHNASSISDKGLENLIFSVSNPDELNTFYIAKKGWSEVSGGGLTLSRPAAVMQGNLHLFVSGLDDRIYVNSRNGNNWSGWGEVPGGGLTKHQPSSVVDSLGYLHLFVTGTDKVIYENILSNGQWGGWKLIGGLSPSGPKAISVGTDSSGYLKLLARGTNDRIYINTKPIGFDWQGWSEVPGNGLTPSSPAAIAKKVSNNNYLVTLFVRGTDNHIYVNDGDGGLRWSGWSEVPGNGLTDSHPTAVYDNGKTKLYVSGINGRVYVNINSQGRWSGWSEVPGNGSTQNGLEALLDENNTTRLFAQGIDNRIYNYPVAGRENVHAIIKDKINANPAIVIGLNLEDGNYALVLDGGTNIHALKLDNANPTDLTKAQYLGNKTQEFVNAFGVRAVGFIGVNDVNEGNTSPQDDVLYVRNIINDTWLEYPLVKYPTLEELLAVRHPLGNVVDLETLFSNPNLASPTRNIFAYKPAGKEIDNLYAISSPLEGRINNLETAKDIVAYKGFLDHIDPRISRFREPLKFALEYDNVSNPPQLFKVTAKSALDYWYSKTGITYVLFNKGEWVTEEGTLVRVTTDGLVFPDGSFVQGSAGISEHYPNMRSKKGKIRIHPTFAYTPYTHGHEQGHIFDMGHPFDPDYPPDMMNYRSEEASPRTSRLLRQLYKLPFGADPDAITGKWRVIK